MAEAGVHNEANVVGNGGNQNNAADAADRIQRMLEERVEKKEEQILKMETSVFQLANYYFVFQGVILTAIIKSSSSSSLKCEHFWLLFTLSLIGAILNFGTLFAIADKYRESLDTLDSRTLISNQHMFPETFEEMHQVHKRKKAQRRAIMLSSMILFSIFVVLNLIATWMIPCRS